MWPATILLTSVAFTWVAEVYSIWCGLPLSWQVWLVTEYLKSAGVGGKFQQWGKWWAGLIGLWKGLVKQNLVSGTILLAEQLLTGSDGVAWTWVGEIHCGAWWGGLGTQHWVGAVLSWDGIACQKGLKEQNPGRMALPLTGRSLIGWVLCLASESP